MYGAPDDFGIVLCLVRVAVELSQLGWCLGRRERSDSVVFGLAEQIDGDLAGTGQAVLLGELFVAGVDGVVHLSAGRNDSVDALPVRGVQSNEVADFDIWVVAIPEALESQVRGGVEGAVGTKDVEL